jgi:hypothetical protein
MKGYFITEAQMEDLHRRVELTYQQAESGRNTGVRTWGDLYRSINYAIRQWESEVGKNG